MTSSLTTVFPIYKTLHFRPPAKAICNLLPAGAALFLIREPDNQYDPNAIQVWIEDLARDYPEVANEVLEHWMNDEDTADVPPPDFTAPFHLGYIHREYAEVLAPQLDAADERGFLARLSFTADGRFGVEIATPETGNFEDEAEDEAPWEPDAADLDDGIPEFPSPEQE